MLEKTCGASDMENAASEKAFRSYLLFWSGQLTSLLGSSVAQFVIIWWITLETESTLYLSLAALFGLAPMVVLAPFAGVFADRWNRKMLVITVDFLQALATVALIFLFWTGIVSIWSIFVLLTLRGIFQAFHQPAVSAITPSMVPKEKLSRMNGINYLFTGAVTLVGPVVGAFLLGFWRIQEILWIDIVTFVLALTLILTVTIPSVRTEHENSSFHHDFMAGFNIVKSTRGFLPLLFLATAINFLLTPLSTLLSYYVKFDHLGGAPEFALVMAFLQGGILGGGLFMSLTKGFRRRMLAVTLSLYLFFLGYALIALTPTGWFWFMAISGLFAAFFVPIVNVSLETIMQTIIPLNMQGRVSSVTMALAMAAQPLGMILSGVVAVFTGTAYLFLGCAAVGILSITISWFFTDVRHVGEAEAPTLQQPL
jgi:DHA3 family macrolide efflux protein-like MFS transporter